MKKQRKLIGMAMLSYVGLSLDLANHAEGTGWHQTLINMIASFRVNNWSGLWMIIGFYFLYRKADQLRYAHRKWTLVLPAACFALNMVLGFSFFREGRWDLLLGVNNGQLLKTAYVFMTWYIAVHSLLKCIYSFLEKTHVQNEQILPTETVFRGFHPIRLYISMWSRHSFMTPFLTLWILALPRILISFPALFMGDTIAMVFQAYPELQNPGLDYLSAGNLLREGVYINQHHPVLYTVLLHAFLQIGTVIFHSLNAGVFLFCLMQTLLTISAFSYALSTLIRTNVSWRYAIASILYVVVHPQISNCLMLVTKDICYSACFLFLLSGLFRMKTGFFHRKEMVTASLSALGVLLLRNEGKYVLLISGLLIAITDPRNRRSLMAFTAAMMVTSLIIYQGLYPWLGFTKGSIREMLSIPFQQTARTFRDNPENVLDEEKEVISHVLDVDQLAESYNVDWADPVKELYQEGATTQELSAYFQTWFRMLLRHPDTYLQATYGNYYQYFYPGENRIFYESYSSSDNIVREINDELRKLDIGFSIPAWNATWKSISDSLVTGGLYELPVFGLLMTPAFYTWGLLIILCWTAGRSRSQKKEGITLCWLPFLQLLVQFAGPTNGFYGRYLLPIACVMPFLVTMLLILHGEGADTGQAKQRIQGAGRESSRSDM